MTCKLILASSLLCITSALHAEFDTQLGQVYNKSGQKVIQRRCVSFDDASIQYTAPHQGSLSLSTNQSESDLRKSLGLGLEGSFNTGSMSVSGKFSFLNASAKSDYSQTLNMIYQESGATATIAPGSVVRLNSFGEESLQVSVADQADRCGHAFVGSIDYSSGILVNFTSNFSSKSKANTFDGWLEIIATYTFEGKFKSVLTELKEVGRFELNVYGWGRYADFVTTLLNPIQCNSADCGKLDFPGMETYCQENPGACESLQALKKKARPVGFVLQYDQQPGSLLKRFAEYLQRHQDRPGQGPQPRL